MPRTAVASGTRATAPPHALPLTLVLTPVSRRPTKLAEETVARVLASRVHASPAVVAVARQHAAALSPRVSLVIPTRDNLVFAKCCLASILANTRAPLYEVIVVDNGSTDGTAAYLTDVAERHRHVRVIRNAGNPGFAASTNQGMVAATGEVIVLLNDDTVVPPGWLEALCAHLDDSTVGLVGPVTNRAGNESQIETSYRTYGEFLRLARRRATARRGERRDIPMLTMFCLAMRRDTFERIGLLDEQFAIGMFEDDDYNLRARQAGYRIVCADDAFVHHFGATSLGKLAAAGEYGELFDANKRRFEEKWHVAWTPRRMPVTHDYEQLVLAIRALVADRLEPGSRVAVVSRGDDALVDCPGCTCSHFPEEPDGRYAGHHPGSSEEALERLAGAIDRGAEYLLVPHTMRWWLDYYASFGRHLLDQHRVVVDDDACVMFALTRRGGANRRRAR